MSQFFALSVQQPWADLIIRGRKSIELRTGEFPHRGLLFIHAPLKIDYAAAYFFGYREPARLTRGFLVGVVRVVETLRLDRSALYRRSAEHCQVLPMNDEMIGIVMSEPKRLARPIPMRGQPYLFRVPTDVSQRFSPADLSGA